MTSAPAFRQPFRDPPPRRAGRLDAVQQQDPRPSCGAPAVLVQFHGADGTDLYYQRGWPLPIARLAAAVLCGYVAIGAGIQVLPGAARERFGAGEWAIGAAVTAASLAAVVARPLAGRRADERGPRGVVVCGGLLAGAGALGQLLAPSLGWLVVARLLIGAGEGALFTAAIAWVLSTAPPERRGRIVGRFGLSMWGGLALGPPLGAALAAATSTGVVWWACVIAPVVPALSVLTAAGGPKTARARPREGRRAGRCCRVRRCGPGSRSRLPASATGRSTRSSCCASRRPVSAGRASRWACSAGRSCSRGSSGARSSIASPRRR